MEKMKINLHKDDVCPLCKNKFFNEENKLNKQVIYVKDFGATHDSCYLPFYDESKIKILFKVRCYSIGDTISVTPSLRELRKIYPKAYITVYTFFPEIFLYNPHINEILDMNKTVLESQIKEYLFQIDAFNQDTCNHFATHSVRFSSLSCFDKELQVKDWQYEVRYSKQDKKNMTEKVSEFLIDVKKDKCIFIHPHGTEWSTRDWGKMHFIELAEKLKEKYPDHKIVSIGGKRGAYKELKNYVFIPNAIDLYGKLTLLETIALLDSKCAKLIITPDTGTLHIASCTKNTPIVGIFTLVKSEFRTPVRNSQFGYKFLGIDNESTCDCTYAPRFLTNESTLYECPKKVFYKKVKSYSITNEMKLRGCEQQDPNTHWNISKLESQINKKIELHSQKSLPCFPSVQKVFDSILKFYPHHCVLNK